MQVSRAGAQRIAAREALRLHSYNDGHGNWSIGYGHTGNMHGIPIGPGQVITSEAALELFAGDLKWVEDAINKLKLKLTQAEFDALASLVFNTGEGILEINRTMGSALRTGDRNLIASAFDVYNKAADPHNPGQKVVVAELVHRRAWEKSLFLTGRYT